VIGLIDHPSSTQPTGDDLRALKIQLIAAAFEVNAPADNRSAPAIIVRRTIGEAIKRGDLKFGQKLPGEDIILAKVWEPVNRNGEKLGRSIASFAAENLPRGPQSFNRNAASVGSLRNWHGHDGWTFDRQRSGTSSYEEARFKGYKDGSTMNTWGIPELPVVNGKDRDLNMIGDPSQNLLAFNRDRNSPLHDTFVTITDSYDADWSQSCTEYRPNPDGVVAVRFPVGYVHRDH
jgi:hypothetical protein